jgi:hypothetical protein
LRGRSLPTTRCPAERNSTVLRFLGLPLPFRTFRPFGLSRQSGSTQEAHLLHHARSPFAPQRLYRLRSPLDHRSRSATFRQARCSLQPLGTMFMMRPNADFVKAKNSFQTSLSSSFMSRSYSSLRERLRGSDVNKTIRREDVQAAFVAMTAADFSAAAFTSAHIFG